MKQSWQKLCSLLSGRLRRGVLESRINYLSLTPHGHVRKQAGPEFSRGEYRYDPRYLLQREAAFLSRLDGRYVPRLLASGEGWIEMEHCGVELSVENLPPDWRKQVSAIAETLAEAGIVHRDIKPGNVLVKDGRLYLIDFGWAIWTHESAFLTPRELCQEVPREHIYDNRAALEWVMSLYAK